MRGIHSLRGSLASSHFSHVKVGDSLSMKSGLFLILNVLCCVQKKKKKAKGAPTKGFIQSTQGNVVLCDISRSFQHAASIFLYA